MSPKGRNNERERRASGSGGLISRRRRWAWQNDCRLQIKAMNSYALLEHQWFDKNGDKIII
jgi:hypothetical protein